MLLVKREESRGFDVFFGCFVCVFWCLEEKKRVEKPGREQEIRKMSFSFGLKSAWGYLYPWRVF